MIELSVALRC